MSKTEDKLKEKGFTCRDGFKWVVAHYKDAEKVEHVVHDNTTYLETQIFDEQEEVKSVWYSIGRTIQVKQFEPLKIEMGCALPARVEEMSAALKRAKEIVTERFMEDMEEIQAAVQKTRKGK